MLDMTNKKEDAITAVSSLGNVHLAVDENENFRFHGKQNLLPLLPLATRAGPFFCCFSEEIHSDCQIYCWRITYAPIKIYHGPLVFGLLSHRHFSCGSLRSLFRSICSAIDFMPRTLLHCTLDKIPAKSLELNANEIKPKLIGAQSKLFCHDTSLFAKIAAHLAKLNHFRAIGM